MQHPERVYEDKLRSVSIAGLMYPVLAIAEDILEGHIAKIDCGGICETLYLGMGKGRHASIVSLVVARADPTYVEVRIAGWRCAAVQQGIDRTSTRLKSRH